MSESRGVSPTVGLAFVNVSTGEAVLSQICDNQFYVRTILKLQVFEPTEILLVNTSGPPNMKSKMYSLIEENVIGSRIVCADRRYWSESAGMDYIQSLAFPEDVEAIKVVIGGNFYATCCLAAVCILFQSGAVPFLFPTNRGVFFSRSNTWSTLYLSHLHLILSALGISHLKAR